MGGEGEDISVYVIYHAYRRDASTLLSTARGESFTPEGLQVTEVQEQKHSDLK